MDTRSVGTRFETLAQRYLEQNNWQIVARNVRCRHGEVDIVGVDAGEIVFVEVKGWRTLPVEALQYSIGPVKRRRIITTARYFLLQNPRFEVLPVRFDVVLIGAVGGGVYHIRDAFVWDA